ncbi:hypothetical protein AVEN_5044-1 [Araneus ventricosus]|uniref:Uncharacterized protein n=1 Tax=Araneus ventricosus TaxID=182803 RepID=A0A4Y2K4A3_ARAVE|nr:hypothetical protein AVEN_5044-1 [Araneus ventricosus]
MMSTSDYMVESTAYPFHLDPQRNRISIHIDPQRIRISIHIDPQRIRRPFIYTNIIQKMTHGNVHLAAQEYSEISFPLRHDRLSPTYGPTVV